MIGNKPDQLQTRQSVKRQQRGAAARVLLTLHEADQLAQPELWTWELLDALPNWCLQDEQARSHLQLLCGALVLAPELRLWIDRELILAAHKLIGKPHFNQIVAKADRAPIALNASAASRFKSVAGEAALLDSVKTALLQAGASVLKASLTDKLLVDMFAAVLGDNAGDVSGKLANTLLHQAECLLEQTEAASEEGASQAGSSNNNDASAETLPNVLNKKVAQAGEARS